MDTILLTGLPRAGTTLCCHILNSHPNVLALHEPLTPTDFDPAEGRAAAVARVVAFAQQSRTRVLEEGLVLTRQKDGKVPENPVAHGVGESGLRPMNVDLGDIDVRDRALDAQFTLVIKHNALFTALLPELARDFPVYGIVRNPLAVLASWNLVDLPVNVGHIPAGEQFDPALKRLLADTTDRLERQLHIIEWFCQQYVQCLESRVLRYEDFVVRPHVVAETLQLSLSGESMGVRRQSRNVAYDLELMERLYQRLKGFGDAIWHFYSPEQIDELMDTIRASA